MPGFLQPIENRVLMTSTGIRAQVGVKLFGDNLDALQAKAFEIERVINRVQGATGVAPSRVQGKPYLEISVRREELARYGLSVQTAWSLAARWNLVLRQTYQEIRTYNVVEDCLALDRQFCPATLSGPSASLVSDTRDDALDPHRGYFLLTDAQLSHRALGGDTLVKAFVQASGYRPLAPRVILAVSGRVGMGRTFGEEELLLPIPERFFAGGDYSLRGFGVDDVRTEGGNGVLLGTAELRVDTGGGFSTAAFADAGNVYRLASEMALSDLRYTAGVGLRYKSALGPLRLDWGFKLDRRPGESASHVHVTIGHAF